MLEYGRVGLVETGLFAGVHLSGTSVRVPDCCGRSFFGTPGFPMKDAPPLPFSVSAPLRLPLKMYCSRRESFSSRLASL